MHLDHMTAAPRSIAIGGVFFRVSKLRIRDFGRIEAWLRDQVEDPRLVARRDIADLSDEEALPIWLASCAKPWPPATTTDEGQELLSTDEGVALIVGLALAREQPSLTPQALAELSALMTIDERRTLFGLCLTGEPGEPRNPDDPDEDDDPKAVPDWGKVFVTIADRYGWTFDQIADMTPDQVLAARGDGTPIKRGSIGSDEDVFRIRRDFRKYL